jgi:hypothetical protein
MWRCIGAIAVASAAASSCVEVVGVAERPCPCSQGYQCCEAIQRCLPPEEVAVLHCALPDGGADTAAPARDAGAEAPARGDAGAPGPDAPLVSGPPPAGGSTICENGAAGLTARYFAGSDFTGREITRVEAVPAFHWGTQPPDPSLPAEGWSALLGGQLQPTASETYTFALHAPGGGRLWVGGELLIDWWRRPFFLPITASLPLQAGRTYEVLVEYRDPPEGEAALSLRWQSTSTPAGVIPQCHLFPAAPRPGPCPQGTGDCELPAPCPKPGRGLRLTQFNEGSGEPPLTRIVPTVSAFFPSDPDLPNRARWEGTIDLPVTGAYTFYLVSAGRARVHIDGDEVNPLVEVHTDGTDGWLRERQGDRPLMAGKHRIEVDHQLAGQTFGDLGVPLLVQLRWKPPGGQRSVLPSCLLEPPAGAGP